MFKQVCMYMFGWTDTKTQFFGSVKEVKSHVKRSPSNETENIEFLAFIRFLNIFIVLCSKYIACFNSKTVA